MQFNFYDHLTLQLISNGHKGYENYFKNEYDRICLKSVAQSGSPSIIVHIVRSLPETQEGDIHQVLRVKNLFTFAYLIRNLSLDITEIFFRTHLIDKIYINAIAVFLQAQLLEPVMYMKLLKKDIILLHASGVSKDGNAFLFPAHGGTGKTTFCIALMQHGYKLLGDDLIFVDTRQMKAFPYARPLHLFTYNINNLSAAKVPLKYRIAIYIKNVIRAILERILKTDFLISTRVHADEVLPSPFGEPSKIKAIFFLKKTGDPLQDTEISANNIKDIVRMIAESADLNNSFNNFAPNTLTKLLEERETEVISSLLNATGKITFINTRKLDLDNLKPFILSHLGDPQ